MAMIARDDQGRRISLDFRSGMCAPKRRETEGRRLWPDAGGRISQA